MKVGEGGGVVESLVKDRETCGISAEGVAYLVVFKSSLRRDGDI